MTMVDVLGLLDGHDASFAEGVARGSYTFWLGSGISMTRVEGLRQILRRALRKLHELSDPADDACKFRSTLQRIVQLSGLSPARLEELDLTDDPEQWPAHVASDLIDGLARNYSQVLDVRIPGESRDFLLWEVIDVRASYASGALEPACEHVALAILSIEGYVSQILTANWDGLIEAAFQRLGSAELQVCVCADDLAEAGGRVRLIKFHGCALRARDDEAKYRRRLIHQKSQIADYHNNEDFRAIRVELVSEATKSRTLMIGLSAQDADIQMVFSDAGSGRVWPFPANPPAYVFAEDELGADQGTILRTVYKEHFDEHPDEIEEQSVVRTYAKPLLSGLVLFLLCRKLQVLAARCDASVLGAEEKTKVAQKIQVLRDLAALALSAGDCDVTILRFAEVVSVAMQTFRRGDPDGAPAGYWPITASSVSVVEGDPEIPANGLPEAALALGVLGTGVEEGWWSLDVAPHDSTLRIASVSTGLSRRLYFNATPRATVRMLAAGAVETDDGDVVVIHSDRFVPPATRSPRSAPGRTGVGAIRHVNMSDVLDGVATAADLGLRFREEAGL